MVPDSKPNKPTWCRCQSACCWWINPTSGQFGCWSGKGRKSVSFLGINNALLTTSFPTNYNEATNSVVEFGCIQKETIKKLIDETPSTYLFKQLESMIIRIRPGFSSDTFFMDPPANAGTG